MSAKDAKRWLMRGWDIEKEIRTLEIARSRAEARAARLVSMPAKGAAKKKPGNRDDSTLVEYASSGMQITAMIHDLEYILSEIIDVIGKVQDTQLRNVLMRRYVLCMRWERICEDLHYSERQIHNFHGRALLIIGKILCEKQKSAVKCS